MRIGILVIVAILSSSQLDLTGACVRFSLDRPFSFDDIHPCLVMKIGV